MADRTSAGLFGLIFKMLSNNPSEEHKKIAKEIWNLRGNYDFSEYQIEEDEALIKLELAREENGEIIYED